MVVDRLKEAINGNWDAIITSILRYGIGALIAVMAVIFIGWYQHQALQQNTAAIRDLATAVTTVHSKMRQAETDMNQFVILQSQRMEVLIALQRISCRQSAKGDPVAQTACDTAGLR